VIAIIGILASVVLVRVNAARDKSLDAAIKSDLKGVVTMAAMESEKLNNTYNNQATPAAITGDCSTLTTVNTIFQNTGIQAALAHAKKSNGGSAGGTALTCSVDIAGAAYAIVAPLKSGGFWCIDSNGTSRSTTGTAGTVAYDGAVAATGIVSPALALTTSTACN